MQPTDIMLAGARANAAAPAAAPKKSALLLGPGFAELSFFLLFPGFFAYQTALGLGLIRAYLGGYFTVISLLILPPLLLIYLRQLQIRRWYLPRVDFAFLAFMAYFSVVVLCNAVAGASNPLLSFHHLLAILFLLNLFIIFKNIDFQGRRFRLTQLASLAAMSAVVFSYSVDGVFYLAALGAAKDPDSVATYQGFSRSYLLPFIATVAFTRSRRLRWAMYALGLPTLYINTARSEFGAMLVLIPMVEFHFSRHRIAMLLGFAALAALLKMGMQAILPLLPDNRTLELLDLSQSTSANLRHQLREQALQTIASHPILGDYASYQVGLYAHNILSAWVDLGLFGFVGLLLLLLFPAFQMALHGYLLGRAGPGIDGNQGGGYFLLAWSFVCLSLMLLLLSHFFTDMMIGAALGAYARYRAGERHA